MPRILQISDCHCYAEDGRKLAWADRDVYPNRNLRAVLRRLSTVPADRLVITGDLADDGSSAAYRRVDQLLADFPLPAYALPGNHDSYEKMGAALKIVGTPRQIKLGNWRLVFLDSNRAADPVFLAGLPPNEHIALFMHHHPVPVGSAFLDDLGLPAAEEFWEQAEKFGDIKAVFHGHVHQEFEAVKKGVKIYGAPATSIQGLPEQSTLKIEHAIPGWREITLQDDGTVKTEVFYLEA